MGKSYFRKINKKSFEVKKNMDPKISNEVEDGKSSHRKPSKIIRKNTGLDKPGFFDIDPETGECYDDNYEWRLSYLLKNKTCNKVVIDNYRMDLFEDDSDEIYYLSKCHALKMDHAERLLEKG